MTNESELLALIWLWGAMMAVMMLPSFLPVLVLFHQISRRHQPARVGVSFVFACSYATVWFFFSVGMGWLHWYLMQLYMGTISSRMTSLLFLLAGVYQFSTWKLGCIKGCGTPFGFLLNDWRPGYHGAGRLGWRYGLFCLGCCWALMLLMIGVGMKSVWGMLLITIMVTVEKLLPVQPVIITRIHGSLLLLWAGVLLIGPFERS